MDLNQLANLGEFIGGVVVLVTLIYLAVQVRHTRTQQENQQLAIALQTTYAASEPAFYTDNARILEAGLTDPRALEGADQLLFGALMSRQLAAIAMMSRADDVVARAMLEEYKRFFEAPGAKVWLKEAQNPLFKGLTEEALGLEKTGGGAQ